MDESEPIIPPEAKKKRFQWIEPVVFLYNIYFFGSFTLISQLIVHMLTLKREKNAFSVHNSTEECSVKGNRMSESSLVLMYADIAAIVPSFFMTILIGGYSDSHGRLSAILFSLVGASLRLIIIFLMFIFDLSVYFLVLSSFVDSFFGMSATFLTSSYAYLADVTTSESRSQRVVLMEVFAGLGSIMSNLLVGYFISNLGYAWSLVILLSIIFFTTVYVSLLKESNESSTSQQTPLMSLRHFTETFKLFKKNERYSRFTLLFTLLLLFLISFSEFGSVNVQVLVIISTPLCLGPIVVGYFLTLVTTCNITCNWICTTLIGKLLGDVGLSLLGAIFGISFYLFFAFSSTKALLFAVPFVGCCSALPIPILKSYASKIIPPEKRGLLLGSLTLAQCSGALLGIMVQNQLYAFTAASRPHVVFLADSAICCFASVCLVWYIVRSRCSSVEA